MIVVITPIELPPTPTQPPTPPPPTPAAGVPGPGEEAAAQHCDYSQRHREAHRQAIRRNNNTAALGQTAHTDNKDDFGHTHQKSLFSSAAMHDPIIVEDPGKRYGRGGDVDAAFFNINRP